MMLATELLNLTSPIKSVDAPETHWPAYFLHLGFETLPTFNQPWLYFNLQEVADRQIIIETCLGDCSDLTLKFELTAKINEWTEAVELGAQENLITLLTYLWLYLKGGLYCDTEIPTPTNMVSQLQSVEPLILFSQTGNERPALILAQPGQAIFLELIQNLLTNNLSSVSQLSQAASKVISLNQNDESAEATEPTDTYWCCNDSYILFGLALTLLVISVILVIALNLLQIY